MRDADPLSELADFNMRSFCCKFANVRTDHYRPLVALFQTGQLCRSYVLCLVYDVAESHADKQTSRKDQLQE
jgi:hypothetical protein